VASFLFEFKVLDLLGEGELELDEDEEDLIEFGFD